MFYDDYLNQAEKASSLLQLDTLIAYQYRETVERKLQLQPEKRLMLAVLEDAIFCFKKYSKARSSKAQRLFQQTEAWIIDPDSGWIFSFESVCEALKLNPSYIRRGLLDWKRTALPRDFAATGSRKSKTRRTRLRFAA
jgi:hypothetical protein